MIFLAGLIKIFLTAFLAYLTLLLERLGRDMRLGLLRFLEYREDVDTSLASLMQSRFV